MDTHSYRSLQSSTTSLLGNDWLEEKEQELTQDTATSPIDLECQIRTDRISKILDNVILKTKLALSLPKLVKEYDVLASTLSHQHMHELLSIFDHYETPLAAPNLLDETVLHEIDCGIIDLNSSVNPQLRHLLSILHEYPSLIPIIEEVVDEIKEAYTRNLDEQDSIIGSRFRSLEYLIILENFRELMVKLMKTTAAEEMISKISTKKLRASNDRLIKTIADMNIILEDEQERFQKTVSTKTNLIFKLKQEISSLNVTAKSNLKKQVLDSDRQMVLASRAHDAKNEILLEEDTEEREGYERLLQINLDKEKKQRTRRFKVETQLLSWLQKYDIEMTDKQVELDDFTDKYDDETRKCEELEEKIREQNKIYAPLMAEKEEEYHRELMAKMEAFRLQHAAKVLQNAWRQLLENRKEKSRLRKLLQKIKAKQEKDQKAATEKKAAIERKSAKIKRKGIDQ